MSKGFQVSQDAHVVGVLPPIDITGGTYGQAFSMAGFAHATIILQIGVSAAAPGAVTLNAAAATAAQGTEVSSPTALTFDVYKQETAGSANDVLGARTAETTSGFTPTAGDKIFYVIELDADALPAGSPYVQLALANTTNSVIASAVAILSGARFAGDQSLTATA